MLTLTLSCTLAYNNTCRALSAHRRVVTQVSGATATVAVIVGWDLVVASVGDSTAFLDTGAEVVQVSAASSALIALL